MQWFSGTRIGILALTAMFIAFLVIGASMGMFGTMFEPFFGAVGATTGVSSTPGASTSSTRPLPTATIRR
jgi:hypothetical protein